jgi:endonuclease V-like protein UPF0215 family
MANARPHVLGVDDGPFHKGQKESVPVVGAMMEGADLVESVAVTRFEVDGAEATDFLARWISGLRSHASTQAVLLGGITIAGLGVVDIDELAARLDRPVIAVNRRDPSDSRLREALLSAGFHHRIAILESTPPATRMRDGPFIAWAGAGFELAEHLVRSTLRKAQLPEPLRVAHMIARALITGESRGRV